MSKSEPELQIHFWVASVGVCWVLNMWKDQAATSASAQQSQGGCVYKCPISLVSSRGRLLQLQNDCMSIKKDSSFHLIYYLNYPWEHGIMVLIAIFKYTIQQGVHVINDGPIE